MRQPDQLAAFITAKRHSRTARHSSLEVGTSGQRPHFSPQRHGLSQELCNVANALLRKAEQERPLRGDRQQRHFRHACRCAGILSAIKRNLAGNARFGHHLMGHRGGRAMKLHGMHILRAIYPVGLLAIRIARERKRAAQYYEEHGAVLAIGKEPAQTREAQHIQDMTALWEEQQWQTQQAEQLRW